MEHIDINLQPLLIIATQGRVANGKSSLIRIMTGTDPMKFKKEAMKNMTIKLGYTNAKFYKCPHCPAPYCYQVNKELCELCGKHNEMKLYVSFVDSPGHNELQTTALSGASQMDYCLLVMAADNEEDPETNEHYKAIKILGLTDKTIGVHNKIDMVTKAKAFEHFEKIKQTYDLRYVIPMCAQYGFGLNYLIQILVETIPSPINEQFMGRINSPLKASIIRSFDINKQGTNISDLQGAVIGCTIKTGCIKIGDIIKIIPGIIFGDGTNKPIEAKVLSLKTDNTPLEIAYPGGLIGIGLSIDPNLSKEDRLIGNFIVKSDDTHNQIFKNCIISYELYDDSEININLNDICICMLGTIKRNIKILKINKNNKEIKFVSSINMAGQIGDSIIITKNNKIQLYGKILSFE